MVAATAIRGLTSDSPWRHDTVGLQERCEGTARHCERPRRTSISGSRAYSSMLVAEETGRLSSAPGCGRLLGFAIVRGYGDSCGVE